MVFGPQKGATEEMAEEFDRALLHFSNLVKRDLGKDRADLREAVRRGDWLRLQNLLKWVTGAWNPIIMEAVGLEEELQNADIVNLRRGAFKTPAHGKGACGRGELGGRYSCQVIAFAGAVAPERPDSAWNRA